MNRQSVSYPTLPSQPLLSIHRSTYAGVSMTVLQSFLNDGPSAPRNKDEKLQLERYFNDIYTLFLHKVTKFALESHISSEETQKLRFLLDELIKTREFLEIEED